MKYYIFGLQRSGTTFLEHLLLDNFECSIANFEGLWKHSLVKPLSRENIPTFNIYKNPYTWVESIVFRDPADPLVTSPQLLEEGEYNIGHDKINLVNLCKLYDEYVTSWYPTGIFVKYESLINTDHRNYLLESFYHTLKLQRKRDSWSVPEPGSLFMSEGFKTDSIPYYLEQRPLQLSEKEIQIINQNISDRTFYLLKYNKSV